MEIQIGKTQFDLPLTWLTHTPCTFILCCVVKKDNTDIFTNASNLPAGKTRKKGRTKKLELLVEACEATKAQHPVSNRDAEYQLKKAYINGMNFQINNSKIANINNQIKMMWDQWEMFVAAYG